MRENRMSGSEGGGTNPIVSPYPYLMYSFRQRQDARQSSCDIIRVRLLIAGFRHIR